MRLSELIVEGYTEELEDVIQDVLVRLMTQDMTSIKTAELVHLIAKDGYIISSDELISILNNNALKNFVSSTDKDEIMFSNTLGSDVDASPADMVDVGSMAGDQAMQDINSELPQ